MRAIWSMVDFNRREWSVLAPLATAGFFEVYDVALLTLAAPVIAGGLGVPIALFGIGVALIRLATFGSLPLLRLADRWGRRTLLIASLALFTLATGATALAWGFVAFVGLQMIARVFLSTESALSSLVVAEELRAGSPRHRAVGPRDHLRAGLRRGRGPPARGAPDPARLAALLHRRPPAARRGGVPAPAAPRDAGVPDRQGGEPRADDPVAPRRRRATAAVCGRSSPSSPPSASCRPAASSTPPSSPRRTTAGAASSPR